MPWVKWNTEKQRDKFREDEGMAKQITSKDIRAPRINPYKTVPTVQSITSIHG